LFLCRFCYDDLGLPSIGSRQITVLRVKMDSQVLVFWSRAPNKFCQNKRKGGEDTIMQIIKMKKERKKKRYLRNVFLSPPCEIKPFLPFFTQTYTPNDDDDDLSGEPSSTVNDKAGAVKNVDIFVADNLIASRGTLTGDDGRPSKKKSPRS